MDLLDPDEAFDADYLWFYEVELTPERNQAEADEIIATLDLSPGDRVLDAPCGHGRIAVPLAAAGMSVVGVDRSARFLDRAATDATSAGLSIDLHEGDLRQLPVQDASVDAVVCWFTSFGYFDDAGNRLCSTSSPECCGLEGRCSSRPCTPTAWPAGSAPSPRCSSPSGTATR